MYFILRKLNVITICMCHCARCVPRDYAQVQNFLNLPLHNNMFTKIVCRYTHIIVVWILIIGLDFTV